MGAKQLHQKYFDLQTKTEYDKSFLNGPKVAYRNKRVVLVARLRSNMWPQKHSEGRTSMLLPSGAENSSYATGTSFILILCHVYRDYAGERFSLYRWQSDLASARPTNVTACLSAFCKQKYSD